MSARIENIYLEAESTSMQIYNVLSGLSTPPSLSPNEAYSLVVEIVNTGPVPAMMQLKMMDSSRNRWERTTRENVPLLPETSSLEIPEKYAAAKMPARDNRVVLELWIQGVGRQQHLEFTIPLKSKIAELPFF